jgi:hypothetical protein
MKKLILITAIFSFLLVNDSTAQENSNARNSEYCILRVYGQGWVGRYKGIFIVREDLKVEEKDFKDGSVVGILKETMENVILIKNEGYTLVSSSIAASPAQVTEYIFRKQK